MPDSTKLIKRTEDLPKSFCLDNYAGTKDLDAGGWAQVLSVRSRLKNLNIRPDPDSGAINDKFIHELFRDPLNRQTPSLFQISQTGLDEPSLRQLTVYDLHRLMRFLETTQYVNEAKEVQAYSDDFWSEDKTPGSLSESADTFRMMVVDSLDALPPYDIRTGMIHLSVDMTCSDQQLIDEFKNTLVNARKLRDFAPRTKNFNQTHFTRWHNKAVLPYLDITLWARANGTTIPQHVMGNAIFPNKFFDRAQAIRQQVMDLASYLLRRETLKTLCVQSDREKG